MPTDKITNLYKALLSLNTVEECQEFLRDLCTEKEITQMAERLQVAKYLYDGETYENVIQKTEISSTTLSRVSKCVKNGKGYKNIFLKDIL